MPVQPTIFDAQRFVVAKWTGETGTGLAANVQPWADLTIQAVGTGTVTVEGSMDGTNWAALNDTTGAAISLAAATNDMAVALEHPSLIRAVVTGGTATVTVLGSL